MQKYGSRASWEDPIDWIMSSCPWKEEKSLDWSSLLRIRTEDVGCDSPAAVSVSALNCAADGQGALTTEAAESLVGFHCTYASQVYLSYCQIRPYLQACVATVFAVRVHS